jgi:hypothetical protein
MNELRPNQWLGVLVKLTAPMDAVKAAEGALGMEPALAMLPGQKLTQESAIYVGSKSKRMPNFGSICALLDEWWETNRPRPTLPALPSPDESPHAKREKEEEENRASWQSAERVRASLHTVQDMAEGPLKERCGKLLGKALWKYAPHHLGLVPQEWHPSNAATNTEMSK